MIYILSTQLSERETYLIGSIVSQWGFLENDIFEQTILAFANGEALPASMNNAQFSAVLQLWLKRVADKQDDQRQRILRAQHDEILALSEYRQAIVHSRWEWHPGSPDKITAVRAHNKSIKHVQLTADGLDGISTRLGQVRYWIRYPGGADNHATELAEDGGYMSRLGCDLLSGRAGLDGSAKLDAKAEQNRRGSKKI